MLRQSQSVNSIFYNSVDANRIGAVGYSQGAAGVINAHTEYVNGAAFRALGVISLPALFSYNPSYITTPTFYISGTRDGMLSPFRVSKAAYDKMVTGIPAAVAMRKGGDHDAIRLTKLETGYLTAWLAYRLKGEAVAASVFVGNRPELRVNPNWRDVHMKGLR